jgi:phosphatidylglycerophosphate synthase
MPLHPRRCSFLYSISCLLDAMDGIAARKFSQSTRFGAVLDMVTDRCTTTCLLVFLATAKPAYSMIFQGLISLDLASHYMHMYATLVMGGQTQSHKNVDAKRSRLMNLYYSNKVGLFLFWERHYTTLQFLWSGRINTITTGNTLQTFDADQKIQIITDRPICYLRPQRALLHRPLPPLLQLAYHHARIEMARGRWDEPYLACLTDPLDVLRQPV